MANQEKATKIYLRRLAEKLVQADVHSLSRTVVNSALDKALPSLPPLYQSEVLNHKDLYADLLQGYVEEFSTEKRQFDLPYNLYLENEHRKIGRIMKGAFKDQKNILIRNLLEKKFLSLSASDILQIMNVAGTTQNHGRTSLLLDYLLTLKDISGGMTDMKSLLKRMSVSCRILLSAKKSTDISIRKQINLELESLLISCNTRFTQLKHVSTEETFDYYAKLSGLCSLYVESVAMTENKPGVGKKLSNFLCYILKNLLQHQLDVLLQIDEEHLSNENILMPFISKTLDCKCENLSCEMFLRYILAARHVCVPNKYSHARGVIKNFKKKCLDLQPPRNFYGWLASHLPSFVEHLDENDDLPKFLMTCPSDVLESLIILLSRQSGSEAEIEDDDISDDDDEEETSEYSSKKRKFSDVSDISDGLPPTKCFLGE